MNCEQSQMKKVTIIGLGLMGGSLGMALRKTGFAVTGIARREESIQIALKCGAIDNGFTGICKEAFQETDIVVIALPVGMIADTVKEIFHLLKDATVITDVGSTKVKIVQEVSGFLPGRISFIGGHPIAGSEKSGITSATSGLFKDTTCILTPLNGDNPQALKAVKEMWTFAGAKVLKVSPEEHDLLVAGTSHLPHLAAVGLAGLLGELKKENEDISAAVGSGFRDTTRIALSSPSLWSDICFANKDAIVDMLERFEQRLGNLKKMISDGDKNGLLCELEEARKLRRSLDVS